MERPLPRELRTRRLTLASTVAAHADGLWKAVEASLEELQPWLAWAVDASPGSVRGFTERAEQEWDLETGWQFTIVLDDEPAGAIGLSRYMPLWRNADLGYWLRSDLAGRGLMTEAASAVVEFAFSDLGLHRVALSAATDNGASARVAEKIGFKREGLLRESCWGSRGFHDAYVYGLLETDPRERLH